MRVLFFDTETNGLPKSKSKTIPVETLENWPLIVSVAGQVWEISSNATSVKLSSHYNIIKPSPDTEWNTESSAIHKITKERALAEGTESSEVFRIFHELVGTVDVVIAHNMPFDKPVLLAEFLRRGLSKAWPSIEYCTCLNTKELTQIPWAYGKPWDKYKMPKLGELYKYLFGSEGAFEFHSADADVDCLVQCFQELVRRRLVPLETWERNLRVLRSVGAS